MVEGQSQLAVMMVDSGDWKILTTNRDRGLLSQMSWSPQPGGSLHRLFVVPLRGEPRLSPLLPLTGAPLAIDSDNAGHLYVDQSERQNEILRRARGPAGNAVDEKIPLSPAFEDRTILPLRGDRFLFASSSRGISRLMVIEPGKESRPFLESR